MLTGGHTQMAADIEFAGVRYENPGSVSNHDRSNLGARYSTIETQILGFTVNHHEVPYDKSLTIGSTNNCGIPGIEFR